MVTPDVNFVNMLRYSMLAISLLPENSMSRKFSLYILIESSHLKSIPKCGKHNELLERSTSKFINWGIKNILFSFFRLIYSNALSNYPIVLF